MIVHRNIVQGTPEWWAVRLGIPTASCFDKIITPAKGELSKSARIYAQYLVAETLLREPLEPERPDPYWIAWGKENEPLAAQQYAFTTDTELEAVGFVTTNDGRIGCSPDRLIIGQRGAVEIKCPAPQTHTGYLIDGPGLDYKCQFQGQMAVAELEFVDFYSFHPRMPPALYRIERDEQFIAKLSAALTEFLALRDEMLAKAMQSGFFANDNRTQAVALNSATEDSRFHTKAQTMSDQIPTPHDAAILVLRERERELDGEIQTHQRNLEIATARRDELLDLIATLSRRPRPRKARVLCAEKEQPNQQPDVMGTLGVDGAIRSVIFGAPSGAIVEAG